jgi:GntR family transcriptional repressor for pyruvate dehydrogenase complex
MLTGKEGGPTNLVQQIPTHIGPSEFSRMALGSSEEARQPDLAPVSGSAVDVVVRQIRGLIAAASLKVGDNLPTERELCAQFGASRNTVREAMRILKAYGMVEVRPKVGAIIVDNRMERAFDLFSFNTMEVSRKTYVDIQGFRSMVEVDSVERIFDSVVQSDINELREFNRAMRDTVTMAAAAEADFAFHLRLVSILGNAAVCEVYRIMKPVIIRIMRMRGPFEAFATSVFDEHAEIVAALEARKRINYQYALQSHLEQGLRNFNRKMGASA